MSVLSLACASGLRCQATRNEPLRDAATDGRPVSHGTPSGVPVGERSIACSHAALHGTAATADAADTNATTAAQRLRRGIPTG